MRLAEKRKGCKKGKRGEKKKNRRREDIRMGEALVAKKGKDERENRNRKREDTRMGEALFETGRYYL